MTKALVFVRFAGAAFVKALRVFKQSNKECFRIANYWVLELT